MTRKKILFTGLTAAMIILFSTMDYVQGDKPYRIDMTIDNATATFQYTADTASASVISSDLATGSLNSTSDVISTERGTASIPSSPPLECGYALVYDPISESCIAGKVIITTDKQVYFPNEVMDVSFQILGNWGVVEKQYHTYIKSLSVTANPVKQINYTYDPSLRNQTISIQVPLDNTWMIYNGTYYFKQGVSPAIESETFEYFSIVP